MLIVSHQFIMHGSGQGKTEIYLEFTMRFEREFNSYLIHSCLAYVEQDDLLYKTLSVHETIMYSALLRLPRTMTRKEKENQVDKVINSLGLSGCRDTPIGDEVNRGIVIRYST